MRTKIMAGLAAAGLLAISTYAMAGLWPGFPIVGFTSLCWGNTSTATGTYTGAQTGCPNTAPAGSTSIDPATLIPADVYNPTTGRPGSPSTVLLSLASLNAMPVVVSAANVSAANALSATNLQGGLILTAPTTAFVYVISQLNVTLPPTPIDGQQFAISADHGVAALSVTARTPTTQSVANTPVSLTMSTAGASIGYRFMWNATLSTWLRLQ